MRNESFPRLSETRFPMPPAARFMQNFDFPKVTKIPPPLDLRSLRVSENYGEIGKTDGIFLNESSKKNLTLIVNDDIHYLSIVTPSPSQTTNDVLFTCGTTIGSLYFKELIVQNCCKYTASKSKIQQDHIVHSILQKIRQLIPPGRFIRCDESIHNNRQLGHLVDAGNAYARQQTARLLSEESKKRRQQEDDLKYGLTRNSRTLSYSLAA